MFAGTETRYTELKEDPKGNPAFRHLVIKPLLIWRLAFTKFVCVCECTVFSTLHASHTDPDSTEALPTQRSRVLRERSPTHADELQDRRETNCRENTGLQHRKFFCARCNRITVAFSRQKLATARNSARALVPTNVKLCRGCKILTEMVPDSTRLWCRITRKIPQE